MADVAENIPTLTDVVQAGDASMLNHFDAHQFNEITDEYSADLTENSFEDDIQNIMEVSDIIDKADRFEATKPKNANTDLLDLETIDIPSMSLGNETHDDLSDQDFSDSMQLKNKNTIEPDQDKFHSDELQVEIEKIQNSDLLKEKIDLAVKELLPTIETQLKEQLYKQFKI